MGPKPENHTCECLFSNTATAILGHSVAPPAKIIQLGLLMVYTPQMEGWRGHGTLTWVSHSSPQPVEYNSALIDEGYGKAFIPSG